MERPAGNDPASTRWQRVALPLSYSRMVSSQRIELCVPEGGDFTDPLSHQTWRYTYLVAEARVEQAISWL